jgi:serine protease AprX
MDVEPSVFDILPDSSGSNEILLNGGAVGVEPGADLRTRLAPAVPNPSSGNTSLSFVLSRPQRVRLTVLDVAGRLVRTVVDSRAEAGAHQVSWDGRGDDGSSARTGFYICRLVTEEGVMTRPLVLRR